MHPSLHVQRRLAVLAILALIFPIWSPSVITPAAAQDGLVTEKVLTDITITPPAPDGSLSVTRLMLDSTSRTESMILDTPIVLFIEAGEIKLWTRAGTTVDGVPVTSSPATVFVERSQTVIVPGGVRFRVRAWGCGPARLLFITVTG